MSTQEKLEVTSNYIIEPLELSKKYVLDYILKISLLIQKHDKIADLLNEQKTEELLQVQTSLEFKLDIAKENIANWLIIKGFEEILFGIRNSIARVQSYLFLLQNSPIDYSAFIDKAGDIDIDFLNCNIDEQLQRTINILPEFQFADHIKSFNKLRINVQHYNNIALKINNKQDNSLDLLVRRMVLFFETPEGEIIEAQKNVPGPVNSPLKLKTEDFKYSFDKNQIIIITPKMLYDICTTSMLIGIDITEGFKKHYK